MIVKAPDGNRRVLQEIRGRMDRRAVLSGADRHNHLRRQQFQIRSRMLLAGEDDIDINGLLVRGDFPD